MSEDYPECCVNCDEVTTIEDDHRDYRACGMIHPHRYGRIREIQKLPQWCPKKAGFDGIDVDIMTDEWKPYKFVYKKMYVEIR